MSEKDYNLLRPFDLEAAKRGDMLYSIYGNFEREFVAGPDIYGFVCTKSEQGQFVIYKIEELRMAPLCWVEGKPVYPGDRIYGVNNRLWGTAQEDRSILWDSGIRSSTGVFATSLTWTPSQLKREGWINIDEAYQSNGKPITVSSYIFPTRKDADAVAEESRKACIHIEWEE